MWDGEGRALRRRRAEIALAQIGVFLEFGRLYDVTDHKGNILNRRATGVEARVNVLADLLDLRPHMAPADALSGTGSYGTAKISEDTTIN